MRRECLLQRLRSVSARARRHEDGFTLLEVMVSVAILGMGILALIQLFSSGLGIAASTRDHTNAVIIAREKMASALAAQDLRPGLTRGTEKGGFEWQVDITPYAEDLTERNAGVSIYRVVVKVKNRGAKAGEFTLATLKTVIKEE